MSEEVCERCSITLHRCIMYSCHVFHLWIGAWISRSPFECEKIRILDWAKAFDSISPDGLIVAVRRFGIPHGLCSIICAIYSGSKFVVRDAGHTSEPRPQHFGISQGCPLSPFLFSIVMTVLLFEARQPCVLPINELVYSDDTLVVAAAVLVVYTIVVSQRLARTYEEQENGIKHTIFDNTNPASQRRSGYKRVGARKRLQV